MTSVYVAGPMRSRPHFNFPAFDQAAAILRGYGYDVVSPAEHDRENGFDPTGMTGNEPLADLGFDLTETLLWDLEQVAKADAVCVLDGWENSSGARAEVALAHALGKPVGTLLAFPRGGIDPAHVIASRTRPSMNEPRLPRLIGLGGKLGAGKDVVADYLVDKYGYTKLGMSDALHEAMLALDPIVDPGDLARGAEEVHYSEAIAKYGYVETKAEFPEARRLLQALGTEVGRNMIGESVWTDIITRKIRALHADGKNVVVTGLRFPNEIDAVTELDGETAWVRRPGHGDTGGHASENSVTSGHFGHIIENDSSIGDLLDAVDAFLKEIS